MLQGSPVAWVNQNRLLAAGIALIVVAAAVTFALVVGGGGEDIRARVAEQSEAGEVAEAADDQAPGEAAGGRGGRPRAPGAGGAGGGVKAAIPGLPGIADGVSCEPEPVDETGVDEASITIGQIVTDNSQIPQQLKPVNEGLEAFVKLFNASGGLCKRQLKLEYRNDNLNPATHSQDYQQLANRVLAFVGNNSLLDFLDYERQPPFDPTVRGGGGFVPDVGGLAFSYGRSQSRWHAGVVGSVSPVLVGGGQFKYLVEESKAAGKPCTKAGVVYLNEPTRASEDQANVGRVALEASWGGNLGSGNTRLYAANLADPEPAYRVLADRMIADGMNCVFAYTDVQSSINLTLAMSNRGYWPPDKCTADAACFRVMWVPFTVYDQKFIRDAGDASRQVSTFIPHAPLNEANEEAVRVYLQALEAVPGARPSSFSIFGFASGVMFAQALQACPAAPTRECLIRSLHEMQDFTAGGLLGGTTPFRTTRVTYDSYGTHDWKWIFNRSVLLRVIDRDGNRDFYRIRPDAGFFDDTLKVARGTPA